MQLLQFAKLGEGWKFFYEEAPPFHADWESLDMASVVFSDTERELLKKNIFPWKGERVDVIYRISYPLNFAKCEAPVLLFFTSEFLTLSDLHFFGGSMSDLAERCKSGEILPVTPSAYSASVLTKKGLPCVVIPHGVDTDVFRVTENSFRKELGIPENAFVFLSVGAVTENKNIPSIIRAFYNIHLLRPNVVLILKGLRLYSSQQRISSILTELIKQKCINKKIWTKIVEKGCFHFIEESLCSKDMSLLYNTANAYLSPYLAEAFNMPVLEATACGLVTVTTGNGPTAEFVCPTSSIQIPSIRVQAANGRYVLIINDLYFENSLLKLLDDPKALQRAREDGPLWVGERFTWARVVQILQGVMQSTMKPSMRNPDFFC